MTMASMVDRLAEAKCTILRPGKVPPHVEYNSLIILADELGALIHQYDREFMNGLTKIYDGGSYAQHRRGNEIRIQIDSPQLNILAGTTPSNIMQFMPEGAWEQGFASRMVMVYSGDRNLADIFGEEPDSAPLRNLADSLIHDLRGIGNLFGQVRLRPDAIEAFREWRLGGELPVPSHPKLTHYCARRTAHLLKLCLVASVSRGPSMEISAEDFTVAKNWLMGAETSMPDVFKAGIVSGDSKAMDEGYHFVWANFAKTKRPIPEHALVHFMRERLPAHSVIHTIDLMVRDRTLKAHMDITSGEKLYEPGIGRKNY